MKKSPAILEFLQRVIQTSERLDVLHRELFHVEGRPIAGRNSSAFNQGTARFCSIKGEIFAF